MKQLVALSVVGIVVGAAFYCANILRNQEPFWGSVEIAAHTAGRQPRPCPPCADDQMHVQHTWYGWDGKLVRKVVF